LWQVLNQKRRTRHAAHGEARAPHGWRGWCGDYCCPIWMFTPVSVQRPLKGGASPLPVS